MDKSFLSKKEVIAASRDFVCIRLATYESAAEAKVLESIYVGRDGKMKNTTFAVLSHDGRRLLTDAGRGPSWAFGRGTPADQGERMTRIARRYPKAKAKVAALPTCADVRRALNIAACELQPLVVAIGKPGERWIEKTLAGLAWRPNFIGRFIYATGSREDVAAIDGISASDKVVVIQPGAYGLTGRILARASSARPAVEKALRAGLTKFSATTKSSRRHIRRGRRQGHEWKAEIPVTDGPGNRRQGSSR